MFATSNKTAHVLHSTSTTTVDVSQLTPCNHEEADTRLFLHCRHAVMNGLKSLMISTVDSDVVVLAVHYFEQLQLNQLWIKFGVSKNKKFIAIHEMSTSLGPTICSGIPFFHAWTGSDTTSAFLEHGKKKHWNAWMELPRVSKTFAKLSTPSNLSDEDLKELEIYELQVFFRGRSEESIDEARKNLVFHQACPPKSLPPTSGALRQHALRSLLTAGHIWGQATVKHQVQIDPSNFGWKQDGNGKWEPFWTHLPPESKSIINKNCGCKNETCKGHCLCVKAKMNCMSLCACKV